MERSNYLRSTTVSDLVGWYPLVFLALAVGLPLGYLNQPLHFDEAIYLVVAEQVAGSGRLYADVADHKTPLIYVIAAAAYELTPRPVHLLRLLTYAVTAASAALVVRLGRRVFGRAVGMAAGLVFLTMSYLPHFDGFFYMTEPWATLTMLVAALLLLREEPIADAGAGVALAVGVLFNQTVFLFGAAVILVHAVGLRYPERRTRRYVVDSLRRLLVVGAGFLVAVALALAAFYVRGTLDELLYYAVVLPASAYDTQFELYGHLLALGTLLPVWLLSGWTLLRVADAVARGRTVDDGVLLVAVWAAVLSVPGATGFSGDHKLLFAFPAIALLATVGAARAAERARRDLRPVGGLRERLPERSTAVTFLLVATLLCSGVVAAGGNVWYAVLLQDEDLGDQRRSVDGIADHVEGDVYGYPVQAQVFYHADGIEPATTWVGHVYADEVVTPAVAALRSGTVDYVVVRKGHVVDGRVVTKGYWPEQKEPIVAQINARYEPVAETDTYVVFGRADGTNRTDARNRATGRPTPRASRAPSPPRARPSCGSPRARRRGRPSR
ncbi:ArnT family glycosyltransferase [Halobaculum sp. EA56]|uniref:ArnT family glycosyltransferase n=1 Tax=Halobaculum sp. EA56 TaxID=3421648 RepID=UPI003EB84908